MRHIKFQQWDSAGSFIMAWMFGYWGYD